MMCCDLERGELEFFATIEWKRDVHQLQVFHPRVSCWATPIPRYKELQGMYDGSSFWVENSSPSLHYLSNCMDRVVKSAFYKDYIEHVVSEVTLKMLDEIIEYRKSRIGKVICGERQAPRSPNFDNEWDVLVAGLIDVGADIAAIVNQKAELKQALMRETTELPLPLPGRMGSVFWREPSRGGLKQTIRVLTRGMHSLKREGGEKVRGHGCSRFDE